jgi:cephalosporin-C deacetylase
VLSESELADYRITTSEPDELDSWWARRLERARSLAAPTTVTRRAPGTYGELAVYDVEFSGAGGDRIRGWYLRPAGSPGRRLPVAVTFPGYGRGRGRPIDHTVLPAVGFGQLIMDIRGQHSSLDPGTDEQHIMVRGIADPDTYYFTTIFIDAARAVDIVAELPGADPDLVAVEGGSQGGGLALAAAALSGERVRVCQAEVPMLCDLRRAIAVSTKVPYRDVATFLARYPERAPAALNTLRYVDCALLARRITATCLLAVGLRDEASPPSTVYAAYHEIPGRKEIAVAVNGDHRVPRDHVERKLRHLRDNLTTVRIRR